MTWDPIRDVIWAQDFFGNNRNVYTIDDDPPYTATFQFNYGNLPGGWPSPLFMDGMGFDPFSHTIWMSEDFSSHIWEVSRNPGPGSTASLITHLTLLQGASGSIASFQHLWLTDPLSDTVRMTDKMGNNQVTYSLPSPDPEYEEDMEYDYQTLGNQGKCLLWIIDRSLPQGSINSKIEAYIIPCDRPQPIAGELLPYTIPTIGTWLLTGITVTALSIGLKYRKRK